MRCGDGLAQRAGRCSEEAVGRHAADIVEEVAFGGRGTAARITAERAGEAAAHADAVEAAQEPGAEDHQMVAHGQTHAAVSISGHLA